MLMEIAVGVIIVIGILGFIGYSYMIKQQSDEVRKLYEDFKKTYGKEYQIGFGLCKGTVFNKEYIVILAADKEKKVVDAVTAEGSGMEWTHGTASEYIGMDIAKYKKEQEEKKKRQTLYQKSEPEVSPKERQTHHCSQESLSWHAAQRKKPACFVYEG